MMIRHYIPELNYYFEKYWKENAVLTTNQVKVSDVESELPSHISVDMCNDNAYTFLNLLFNNHYQYSVFGIYFRRSNTKAMAKPIMERLNVLGNLPVLISSDSTCSVTDTTATIEVSCDFNPKNENIFEINEEEQIMLGYLLRYRMGKEFSFSFPLINLNSPLSKLIYIYLNLMINYDYSYFYVYDKIATKDNLLENLFEIYVLNEAHKLVKDWDFLIDSDLLRLYPLREMININEVISKQRWAPLSFDPKKEIYIFLNGDPQNIDDFEIFIPTDTTGIVAILSWSEDTEIKDGDIMLVDSYSLVKVPLWENPDTYEHKIDGGGS